jgi:hypothetical protein
MELLARTDVKVETSATGASDLAIPPIGNQG